MPFNGPQSQWLYYPHEAYDVIGRQRFGHEWHGRLTGQPPKPDLSVAREHAAIGLKLSPGTLELLNAEPIEADRAQTQLRREDAVLKDLKNAVLWGKAGVFHFAEKELRPVPVYDFYPGTPERANFLALLKEEILAVLRDGRPPRGLLLIDKEGLDRWIRLDTPPDQRSPLVAPKPVAANRPAANVGPIRKEFALRRDHGQVDVTVQGWRSREAEYLAVWYAVTHPEDRHPPKAPTIRKHLKPIFDAYEHRLKGG